MRTGAEKTILENTGFLKMQLIKCVSPPNVMRLNPGESSKVTLSKDVGPSKVASKKKVESSNLVSRNKVRFLKFVSVNDVNFLKLAEMKDAVPINVAP